MEKSKPLIGLAIMPREWTIYQQQLVDQLKDNYEFYLVAHFDSQRYPLIQRVHFWLDALIFRFNSKSVKCPLLYREHQPELIIAFSETAYLFYKGKATVIYADLQFDTCIDAVMQQRGVVPVLVVKTSAEKPGNLCYHSSFRTDLYSISRNYQKYLERLFLLTRRAVMDIGNPVSDEETYGRKIRPSHNHFLEFLKQLKWIFYHTIIKLYYTEQWHLAEKKTDNIPENLEPCDVLPQPKSLFRADPFFVKTKHGDILFFEEQPGNSKKAHISRMYIGSSSSKIVLNLPFHLSYPFVFDHAGEWYMIPEAKESGRLICYKATSYPDCWEMHRVLFDNVKMVDPTFFFYNKKWWLFVNQCESGETSINDELYLYFTDSIFDGEWLPHPLNPIISNSRCARPAGKIFLHEGKIFRPTQDHNHAYGKGIRLMTIELLTEAQYKEKEYICYLPDNKTGIVRYHTFQFQQDRVWMDVMIRTSRLKRLIGR